MKVVRISLLGLALTASATVGFAQKTKIVTKQCLDSLIWDRYKYTFSYDERGNNTQGLNYVWSWSSETEDWYWDRRRKYDYTYDEKGNRTKCIECVMPRITDEFWTNDRKHEYTYDDKGNRIEYIFYRWIDNEWEDKTRYEFRYNDKGDMIEMFIYEYYCGPSGCGWNISSYNRYGYTYDAKGNITEKTHRWGGDWLYKYEYTYDDMGNMIMVIQYRWHYYIPNDWCVWYKDEYVYDEKGYKTKHVYSEHNGKSWKEVQNHEYNSYDSIGNYTEHYFNKDKYDYEYAYNLSYSNADLVLPDYSDIHSFSAIHDYLYNGMVTERKVHKYYSGSDNKFLYDTCAFYWSPREIEVEDDDEDETGIVSATLNNQLWVYPNPANGQLTIDCRDVINHVSTVEIYNVVGQCVYTPLNPPSRGEYSPFEGGRGMSEITIDISHLPAGMYFLKIGNRTARFVKE